VRSVAQLAERAGEEPMPLDRATAELMAISGQPADWAQTALFDSFTANVFAHDANTNSVSVTVPAYARIASSWRT
jgi:hypothetical protein